MLKRLILCVMSFVLFVAVGGAHTAELHKGGAISFEGEFDKLKALKAIYGELTLLKDGSYGEPAIWRDIAVPKPLSTYYHRDSKADVRTAFDSQITEDGIERHVIITYSVPAEGFFQCHACAPLIGGAVFKRSADGWIIESQNKYITVIGKWGKTEKENIAIIEIGSGRYGVLFRGSDIHQGYMSNYISLIVPYKNSLVESLQFFVEGPSIDECTGSSWEQDIELSTVRNRKDRDGYYIMKASIRYNKGDCGHVRPVKERRSYYFNKGKYQRKK